MNQSVAFLARVSSAVWRRRWWMLVPAVLSAAVTSVMSYYFLPTRFQSEASLLVVPGRVSSEYVRSSVTGNLGDRLQQINDQIMRTTQTRTLSLRLGVWTRSRMKPPAP